MARDLWRWMKGLLATALWSFVLAGLLGMAEGLSQWLRFDVLHEGGPGFVRSVAPTVALYGWVAMFVATLFYIVFYLLMRCRPHPRRQAYAYAVSTLFGVIFFFYAGYLGREHVSESWWIAHETDLALVIQSLVMIAVAVLFAKPVLRLASRQVLNPWRNLFLAVAFLVVFTSLWPNWRADGCRERTADLPREAAPAAAPNVVLVTIDTLRRDMLSILSPEAPPTPGLDTLAEEGVLFTNFWSTSCWTLPSMSSLMTGHAPRTLAVAKYAGLPEDVATLAQLAYAAGWQTAAVASNPYLLPDYGFERGFADYEHAMILEPLQPAGRSILARELSRLADERLELNDAGIMVGKALLWLDRRHDEAPYFLWVHLMDPHVPYRWRDLPEDAPPVERGVPADRSDVPDHPWFSDDILRSATIERMREAWPELPAPEVRRGMRTLYRREVRYADACLSRLWTALRARDDWDETLVIVTADHGEEFFEHGGVEHGHSLMPEVTGVPLIARLPGGARAGARVDVDYDLSDVLPSLCARLGWPAPPGLEGETDLFDDGPSGGTRVDRPAVLENMLYGGPRTAVRAWPYLGLDPGADGRGSWFDLAADPGAAEPLTDAPSTAEAIVAGARARQSLWDDLARSRTDADRAETGVDPSLQRKLRSLGY